MNRDTKNLALIGWALVGGLAFETVETMFGTTGIVINAEL